MEITTKKFTDQYDDSLKIFTHEGDEGAIFECDGSPYLKNEQIRELIDLLKGILEANDDDN